MSVCDSCSSVASDANCYNCEVVTMKKRISVLSGVAKCQSRLA